MRHAAPKEDESGGDGPGERTDPPA
jgi:hypothetical protein